MEAVVDPEEVDLAGPARLLGGSSQLLAAEERIDKAGLADVGAAGTAISGRWPGGGWPGLATAPTNSALVIFTARRDDA